MSSQLSIVKISLILALFALVQLSLCAQSQEDLQANSSQNDTNTQTTGEGSAPGTSPTASTQVGRESARSGRMLDLDRLAGEVSTGGHSSSSGRQSRRLAHSVEGRSKKAKKMAIKGFIPIVSIEGAKDGKQLDELAADAEQAESAADEHEQAELTREQVAAQFGAHTSLGHASFAPNQAQQTRATAAWQPAETGESARARKLLAGHLFAGQRQALRPLGTSLVAGLVGAPGGHQHLAGPMNVAPPGLNLGPSQPYQVAPVALGAEQTGAEPCVCVPFYQCRNGFLAEPQSSPAGAWQAVQAPRSLGQQQLQPASQPSDQQTANDIYEQLRKRIESENLERELLLQQQQQQQQPQLALLDERHAAPANSSASDGEERSLLNVLGASRRQSASIGRQCGIMRTCCRVLARPVQQQQQQPHYQLVSPNRAAQLHAPAELGAELALSAQPQQFAPAGSFMAGRCGLRQTLGVTGRVQNAPAQAQGELSQAEFGEFPAHAAILRRVSAGDSLFVCSAVLVSAQWLATAAHCVRKLRADELKVRLGEWDVSRDDEFYPHVEANVRELLIHPHFQPASLANDVALVRMDQSVGLGEQLPHVAPACLAHSDQQFAGQRCWLAGWGKDAFGQAGAFQATLRKVDLPVVAHDECEHALRQHTRLGRLFRLHASNVCAGGERGKDACEGDGGAGLYCVDPTSGLSRALGLVSWGVGCGQRGVPGVYASLAQLGPWIEQQVAASGEPNLYAPPDELGARQQPADPFRALISERSSANATSARAGAELSAAH